MDTSIGPKYPGADVVPERWQIWLTGTTSRPGSHDHNMRLSRRRAEAVAEHIKQLFLLHTKLAPFVPPHVPPKYDIDLDWQGELRALFLGRPERRENLLDRAVLIAFQPVYPKAYPGIKLRPPAPNARPILLQRCHIEAEIAYLKAVRTAWTVDYSGFSGPIRDKTEQIEVQPNALTWDMSLTGFSQDRKLELYASGPYSKANLHEAKGMPMTISRDITYLESLLPQSIAGGTCQDSVFRKK